MYSALIIVIVALLFSAFFSGMEIAFTSANKLKLEIDRKQNPIFGRIIRIFTSDAGQYLTTILVGNNIALVIYSTYMTLLIHFVAESWGMPLPDDSVIIETLISTIVIIFTAEFTPKAIVKLNPNRYLKIFAVPVVLHAVWDMPIPTPSNLPLVQIACTVLAWVMVLVLINSGLKQLSTPEKVEVTTNE